VGGACEYKLAGSTDWIRSSSGEKFSVPANSKFEIRVAEGEAAYHYICHFA
jgi:purine/pyrimidine-nucleoside phosphorylase